MNREEFKKIVAEAKAIGYKEGYTAGYAAGEQDAEDRQDYQAQREAEECG